MHTHTLLQKFFKNTYISQLKMEFWDSSKYLHLDWSGMQLEVLKNIFIMAKIYYTALN